MRLRVQQREGSGAVRCCPSRPAQLCPDRCDTSLTPTWFPLPRSPYALWLLRMITSCEVKRRADFFAPFVMVGVGVGWRGSCCALDCSLPSPQPLVACASLD